MSNTIDTAMARQMVEACAIRGASIIGQPGGWSIMLKVGLSEKLLGTQRTDKPRKWRSLDACMGYVTNELRIFRLDSLDASNFSKEDVARQVRADSSVRLKRAHEAAAYEKWFLAQVEEGIREADDPNTVLIPHDVVKADMAAQRKLLQARIKAGSE
jgi:hypothetical protein